MRELHLVELVSPDGIPVGAATVHDAHTAPGSLHRAFSVLLFDPDGRTLLQQRAATKTRFPLRWANACCGHPAPGEPVLAAAGRRLQAELGFRSVPLAEAGVYTYRAVDAVTGRVEHEYDQVLVGRIPAGAALDPDPAEVAALRWTDPAELAAVASSSDYAPWLSGVLAIASTERVAAFTRAVRYTSD
jgi:isopentenyl-diphosphate delta-isomerase